MGLWMAGCKVLNDRAHSRSYILLTFFSRFYSFFLTVLCVYPSFRIITFLLRFFSASLFFHNTKNISFTALMIEEMGGSWAHKRSKTHSHTNFNFIHENKNSKTSFPFSLIYLHVDETFFSIWIWAKIVVFFQLITLRSSSVDFKEHTKKIINNSRWFAFAYDFFSSLIITIWSPPLFSFFRGLKHARLGSRSWINIIF